MHAINHIKFPFLNACSSDTLSSFSFIQPIAFKSIQPIASHCISLPLKKETRIISLMYARIKHQLTGPQPPNELTLHILLAFGFGSDSTTAESHSAIVDSLKPLGPLLPLLPSNVALSRLSSKLPFLARTCCLAAAVTAALC